MSEFFPYGFDNRFRIIWWPLGARPGKDGVRIDDGTLTATFGRLELTTPLSNVAGSHVTRDYRWWTAVGVRLSLADDGLTFGTNSAAGVCIHFHHPVRRVLGRKDHSALTVTVHDPEGLVAVLGDATPAS